MLHLTKFFKYKNYEQKLFLEKKQFFCQYSERSDLNVLIKKVEFNNKFIRFKKIQKI